MNGPEPMVAVVICCYTERRWQLLSACVSEAAAQARAAEATVVLVVDHNESLRRRCASAFAAFDSVLVVANRHERGLSGARNTGTEMVDADIVLFVDDDAVPQPGWLSTLRAAFTDTNLLAAGGEVVAVWPDPGARPSWFPPEFDWVIGCDYAGIAMFGTEIRNPIGANMALRRSALRRVGGFRQELGRRGGTPSGCEETDLAIRMRAAAPHGSIRRIPGAPVHHHVEADRCTGRYLLRRCFAEGRSKATLMRMTGTTGALSAEADHALITLPRAVGRELIAWTSGDRAAPSRIGWTALGLSAAVVGWLFGCVRRGPGRTTASTSTVTDRDRAPVWCVEVGEVPAAPVSGIPADTTHGVEQAHVLVRVDHRPVGQTELTVRPGHDLVEQMVSAATRFRDALPEPALPAASWPPGGTSVSVVLCTLGRAETLATAVAAVLHGQIRPAREVIVVDNAPASGCTVRALAEFDDPRLRIVAEPRRGVSWARNTGVAAATSTVVAFTDDDVAAEPDWLARLSEVFDADTHAEIGCVTGLVVPADLGLATHRWFEQSSGFERGYVPMVWEPAASVDLLRRLRRYEPYAVAGRRGPAFPVAGSEFGSGNNMALRRDWLLAAGGFDTVLGTGSPARGGEDLDMFRRVILDGRALVYQPAAIVRHYHRATVAQLRRQMYDYGVGMCAGVLRYATSTSTGFRATLRVLPGGMRLLLDPASEKNAGKTADYPRSLTWIELAGYAAGPLHLLRSHRRAHRTRLGRA
ncbi:glycosyltransferase family 2 protein [Nocardia sp. 004]|uniref:glycosyltransferase family 2 protein n=1 Tax=Nocardia sp. 004 TaxID=3385978 RepID=UPI0039A13429